MPKAKAKKRGPDMMIVASKVRLMLRDLGYNTSADAVDGLNGYVAWLVEQAAKRAHANNRRTVRAYDFMIP